LEFLNIYLKFLVYNFAPSQNSSDHKEKGHILCSVYTLQYEEHKTFTRKIKQGEKIRYAEYGMNDREKIIQHHVRYLGSNPDNLPEPSSFVIEKLQFGYLAQLILSDSLSANDVYTMLDGMGNPLNAKKSNKSSFVTNLTKKKLFFN